MSGIILVLTRLAAAHHLEFDSIQPNALVLQSGFNVQPVAVVIQGRFGDVSAYLGALRKLVRVQRHQLAATGRLFSVDSVEFAAPTSKKTFPNVKASLTIDAFMFAGGVLATPTQPTPSTPNGTVAAGANP
jgi:hypothetical protein